MKNGDKSMVWQRLRPVGLPPLCRAHKDVEEKAVI